MNITRYTKLFLGIALALVVASVVIIAIHGIRLGTEFTGGSVLGISDPNRDMAALSEAAKIHDVTVTAIDDTVYELRANTVVFPSAVKEALSGEFFTADMVAYENSIGPSLGKELFRKSITALILVSIAIIVFIAFAFSGIDEARARLGLGPSSWSYGVVAVLALLHDLLIPTAIFVLLGKEVTSLYIVGALSILGLSVNDTIVVFDRIRDRIRTATEGVSFTEIVGTSITDTFTRSVNTSLTLMLALAALMIFGPSATHDLALLMLLGTFFGTYSSIFVASPLLTLLPSPKPNPKSGLTK
jgi:preprotein translocase SecF subunit